MNSTLIIALVLAAACWGAATVITKHVLTHIPPLTVLVLQLTISVSFLWMIVFAQRLRLPQRRDIVRLGGIGILNPGLAYTFGLLGLTRTTASMSTLLWAVEPILILGLAWLILRERLILSLIAFSLLAITGVVSVASIDVRVDQTSRFLGNGLILIGVACCALYTVLTRRMVTDLDPLLIVVLQQSLALAWALAISPVDADHGLVASCPGRRHRHGPRRGAAARPLPAPRRRAHAGADRAVPRRAPDHLILTEGYKDTLYPKVEVIRRSQGIEPLCRKEDQLIALVTDGGWDLGVPSFGLDDVEGLVDLLVRHYLGGPCPDSGGPPD